MEQKIKLPQLNAPVGLRTTEEHLEAINNYECLVANNGTFEEYDNLAVQISTGTPRNGECAKFMIDYEVFHDMVFNQSHASLKENLFAVHSKYSKYQSDHGDEFSLPITVSKNIITLNPVKGDGEALKTLDDSIFSLDKITHSFVQHVNNKYTKPKPINSETSLGVIGENVVKLYIPGHVLKSILSNNHNGIVFGKTNITAMSDRKLFVFDKEIMSRCPTLEILENYLQAHYGEFSDKYLSTVIFINMDTIIAVFRDEHLLFSKLA